jgi:predicted RNA binding protein YcfA (HicA-like mRNA interferase family)
MPKKVRELKAMLRQAGFTEETGRGSHVNFWFEGVHGTYITICGKDGDDARFYLEKQVRTVLNKAREARG